MMIVFREMLYIPALFPYNRQEMLTDGQRLVRNLSSFEEHLMGKPNFNFQKRQRELAKQKKNEEKRQRKLEKNAEKPAEDTAQADEQAPEAGEVKTEA